MKIVELVKGLQSQDGRSFIDTSRLSKLILHVKCEQNSHLKKFLEGVFDQCLNMC